MQQPLTLDQIRNDAPFPWKTGVVPHQARILVLDARGKEVPIFHLTRLAEITTEKLANEQNRTDNHGA